MLQIKQVEDKRQAQDKGRSFSEGDSFASAGTIKSPEEPIEMDTGSPDKSVPGTAPKTGGAFITEEFLLKTLKLNTEEIIRSFTSNLGALSVRVDENCAAISANSEVIGSNTGRLNAHEKDIGNLQVGMAELERNGPRPRNPVKRAPLSPAYQEARRSVRMWPIAGDTVDQLWEGVAAFLATQLNLPPSEVGRDDV